ncbi:DNA cytosine methyltransferase [Thermomonas brevis]|uniref:Cytosine-specific methyltransferase n=1 Tax=Thermomonas brevis TaxID=215691 RepID=A0A7G9QQ51_9GAMM|nr:DNA cytosine methyltransferase [Thermomonas brevis]QNN45476.1 DNA cytosine methyltransferase [Thermomonas brevis]
MTRAQRKKDNDKRAYTAVDLFSGCGGLSEGLRNAGFRVKAAVEIEPKAQRTYRLNHRSVRLYEQDIRKLPAKLVLQETGLEPGELDLLAGCPPCQGFSRLRTRNQKTSVNDPRNDLVHDFLRFVRVLRPKTIMLENVPALADDRRFKSLCKNLSRLKYEFVVHVLNAADYGVPQRRKRLILLGSRVHSPAVAEKIERRVTVRDVLASIERPSKTKDTLHAVPESRTPAVREIIKLIPRNGGSRSDLPLVYQLDCHQRNDGFRDVYGRMAWDDVSPTITSGCINPSKGRFLHPSQNRTITLREAALLQGFPRDYRFEVSHGKEAIALMIGNALPPPFIKAHAQSLRNGIQMAERAEKKPTSKRQALNLSGHLGCDHRPNGSRRTA